MPIVSASSKPPPGGRLNGPGSALLCCAVLLLLAGCDKIGLGGPSAADVRREAESRAIGGACRHAGRSIEECFAANRQADKAAVFAGWREMNDYMAQKSVAPASRPAASSPAGPAAGEQPAAAKTGS